MWIVVLELCTKYESVQNEFCKVFARGTDGVHTLRNIRYIDCKCVPEDTLGHHMTSDIWTCVYVEMFDSLGIVLYLPDKHPCVQIHFRIPLSMVFIIGPSTFVDSQSFRIGYLVPDTFVDTVPSVIQISGSGCLDGYLTMMYSWIYGTR